MTKFHSLLAIGCLSLWLGGGRPGHARADCLEDTMNPVAVLGLGTAWAIGSQPFTDRDVPAGFLGSWLTVHAVLDGFEGCLEGENQPGSEHTMVLDELVVGDFGLWQNPDTHLGGQVIRFDGGRVRVFRDISPDASFFNRESFTDGDLLLSGRIQSFLITTGVPRELDLAMQFDGSPYPGLPPGQYFQAGGECDFECQPASLTAPLAEAGYFARISGSIFLRPAVGTLPTTWTSLKRGF
ncbi:MAG: hypothetical protein SGI90_04625 [Candidatus Eisenbacteria bacterium]|nr:hypothetical protein [Candidatus Eisenbacteria bacterium]